MLSISQNRLPESKLSQTLVDVVHDWGQDDTYNGLPSEILEGTQESDDEIIFEPKDPSRLTAKEREILLSFGVRPEELGYDWARNDSCDPQSYEEPKSPSDKILVQSPRSRPNDMMLDLKQDGASGAALSGSCEEMTMEQARVLGTRIDYDASKLTPKQRRSIYKLFLDVSLKAIDLRSPQHYEYYEEKSNPASAPEDVWPGEVALQKAQLLKRSYIEPEDLIERLRKLKPSDNFEPRKHRHPTMEWEKSPLYEKAYTITAPEPDWVGDHRGRVFDIRKRLGNAKTERIQKEINEQRRKVIRDIDQVPTPDLYLLKDMGHSPGGTLFPRYLVKGLKALRDEADKKGDDYYEEEYTMAEARKEEAIDHWKERNPSAILTDDPVSIYRTWPAELMGELEEIDREAIRRGRRRYINLLRETEKKMQDLVAFWKDCGLITGQRTPPASWWLSSWWRDPDVRVPLLWPPRLKEKLDAIAAEFGLSSEKGEKLRLIEMSNWKEAILNSSSEPHPLQTPFPQSLLDELDIIWQGLNRFEPEETEDQMIETIKRWRESRHKQRIELLVAVPEDLVQRVGSLERLRQEIPSQKNAFDSITGPKAALQLYGNRFEVDILTTVDQMIWRDRLRPRTKPTRVDERTSWRDRLRPRTSFIDASRKTTNTAVTQPRKPTGIVKQASRKALKKGRLAKGYATSPVTPDTSDLTHTPSPPNEAPLCAAEYTRPKRSRRQLSSQSRGVQLQGIRKARNSKRNQSRRLVGTELTTECKQRLLYCLTPPQ